MMGVGVNAATWGIAGLATLGVIARPWNFPEFIWAAAGAALLVLFNLLPWPDALAAAAKGTDVVLPISKPGKSRRVRRTYAAPNGCVILRCRPWSRSA
jgi:hypothetical protein